MRYQTKHDTWFAGEEYVEHLPSRDLTIHVLHTFATQNARLEFIKSHQSKHHVFCKITKEDAAQRTWDHIINH